MKQDIYEQVTSRIITQLEQGVIPWKSPYFSTIGFPKNFNSGKEYRGINIFLLGSLRFTSPYFLTFMQAKERGGNVRKGERGSLVVKYGTYTKEGEGEAVASSETNEGERRYLKAYTVFNAAQIEGIEFPTEAPAALPVSNECNRAREIIAGMPHAPAIKEGAAIPCYRPSTDSVHMPERGFFVSEEAYYSTLFHELSHATGHASRLARKSLMENKGMDSTAAEARKVYAEEELVAEMGASFLNAHAGIIDAEFENSAAYLQGWIDALKSKDAKGWIIRAASQAQKAADYILNVEREA
jgi:antirestriction protein ArdC